MSAMLDAMQQLMSGGNSFFDPGAQFNWILKTLLNILLIFAVLSTVGCNLNRIFSRFFNIHLSWAPAFLHDLAHCWDDTHPNLTQANNNAWKGLMEFFQNDGYDNETWGGCCDDIWNEDNATAQDFLGMLIYEPCNYASNLAYYHLATEVCHSAGAGSLSMSADSASAVVQSASFLAFGSSAFHGTVIVSDKVTPDNFTIQIMFPPCQ